MEEIQQSGLIITEVLKITDTGPNDGDGVYVVHLKYRTPYGDIEEVDDYVSTPNDPYGINPQLRQWMSQNPNVPVHVYVPPPEPTIEELRERMPTLTARQFRIGMIQAGISKTQVEQAIAAIPDPLQREIAETEWEYANEFKRTHPLVLNLSTGLGLTPEQLDTLWEQAAQL